MILKYRKKIRSKCTFTVITKLKKFCHCLFVSSIFSLLLSCGVGNTLLNNEDTGGLVRLRTSEKWVVKSFENKNLEWVIGMDNSASLGKKREDFSSEMPSFLDSFFVKGYKFRIFIVPTSYPKFREIARINTWIEGYENSQKINLTLERKNQLIESEASKMGFMPFLLEPEDMLVSGAYAMRILTNDLDFYNEIQDRLKDEQIKPALFYTENERVSYFEGESIETSRAFQKGMFFGVESLNASVQDVDSSQLELYEQLEKQYEMGLESVSVAWKDLIDLDLTDPTSVKVTTVWSDEDDCSYKDWNERIVGNSWSGLSLFCPNHVWESDAGFAPATAADLQLRYVEDPSIISESRFTATKDGFSSYTYLADVKNYIDDFLNLENMQDDSGNRSFIGSHQFLPIVVDEESGREGCLSELISGIDPSLPEGIASIGGRYSDVASEVNGKVISICNPMSDVLSKIEDDIYAASKNRFFLLERYPEAESVDDIVIIITRALPTSPSLREELLDDIIDHNGDFRNDSSRQWKEVSPDVWELKLRKNFGWQSVGNIYDKSVCINKFAVSFDGEYYTFAHGDKIETSFYDPARWDAGLNSENCSN